MAPVGKSWRWVTWLFRVNTPALDGVQASFESRSEMKSAGSGKEEAPQHGERWQSKKRHRAPSAAIAMTLLVTATGSVGRDTPTSRLPGAQIPSLGAHTLLVQADGEGVNPALSAPVTTQVADSSLLALVGGFASNASLPSDNYGNTWARQDPVIAYNGYSGRFNTAAYVVLSAKGGAAHWLRLAKDGEEAGEITAPFIEIRNAGVLQDVAHNYPLPDLVTRLAGKVRRAWSDAGDNASSADLTSGSVTTTGPATLVAVWWGDAYVYRMTAVPNNGFKVIERFLELPPNSGVQCAVAVRQVDRAGTYQVTWSGTPAQGAILWLFAFQAKQSVRRHGTADSALQGDRTPGDSTYLKALVSGDPGDRRGKSMHGHESRPG